SVGSVFKSGIAEQLLRCIGTDRQADRGRMRQAARSSGDGDGGRSSCSGAARRERENAGGCCWIGSERSRHAAGQRGIRECYGARKPIEWVNCNRTGATVALNNGQTGW